jgi:4-hydroxybenzoate polyprenyltransferase
VVFAPAVFSGRLVDPAVLTRVSVTAAALCLISSAVYILNDLLDVHRDRQHPAKRHRPLAAGTIAPAAAEWLGAVLIAAGYSLLILADAPALTWLMVGAYLALHVAYSTYLKGKVIVDVLAISVGFVMRVLIGGSVIGVAVTHWLVLCTFLLAAFLGFSKRRHELMLMGAEAAKHRPVLEFYTEELVDRMSLLTLAVTLTCYILYTVAPETLARYGTDALVYSSLIVMFALFRYLFLIHVKRLGNPVEAVYRDRQLALAIIFWLVYVVAVVYTWPALRSA